MEVALKFIYRGIFLRLARQVYRLINFIMGRASPSSGLHPAFVAQGETTSHALLKHCIASQGNKPALLTRSFNMMSEDKAMTTGDASCSGTIRVMQWNVLADALSSGADNFIKCPREALEWNTRRITCLQEILTYDPDIVLLQEVDHFEDFFRVQLERVGYKGIFKPKPDSPCLDCVENSGPDGCAAFFKSEKFSQVSSTCPVLQVTEHGGEPWMTNQVAVLLRLKTRSPGEHQGKEFLVGTTHLKAKPSWHKLRHLQGLNLLEILEKQADGCPLIFSGDFNAEPSEEVYKAFEASKMELESAYKHLSSDRNSEPAYTTWKIRPSGEVRHTIDYIWYTRNQLQPVSILDLPSEEDVGKDRLPSYKYPSDHLSLVADFAFKP